MELKKTITETIELKPNELSKIIEEYFKNKGFNVTNIRFNITTEYDGYDDRYGTDILKSATITRTTTTTEKL